jgi:hypothetical protein
LIYKNIAIGAFGNMHGVFWCDILGVGQITFILEKGGVFW